MDAAQSIRLEPLGRVLASFGPAAVGVIAAGAKDALLDWLKKNFATVLDLINSAVHAIGSPGAAGGCNAEAPGTVAID